MLYPPIVASTQSVFAIEELPATGYEIKFQISSLTSPNEIGHIGILVAQQSNNKSIVNTNKYPDGIIYKDWNNSTSVFITTEDLKASGWQPGYLYKIQLRFGRDTILDEADFSDKTEFKEAFYAWHQKQVTYNAFSEWSTVMIVKPIRQPKLTVTQEQNLYALDSVTTELISSLTPTFFGACKIAAANKEVEQYYQFALYQGETLLEITEWLEHINGAEDSAYFNYVLEDRGQYNIVYSIRTNNGYESSTKPLSFTAVLSTLGDLEGFTIKQTPDQENARILISLSADEINPITGNFVVSRTSEKSNFQLWEDVKFLNFVLEPLHSEKVWFIDYTIESGITYQYALQKLNSRQARTNHLKTTKVTVDFEYGYLYRDGIQLKLSFNQKMSSFKHTTLRTKQDTLGAKYPYLLQNGNAYYAEFPITGLISYQGNYNESYHNNTISTFFDQKADGIYYKNNKIINENKFDNLTGHENFRIWTDAVQESNFSHFASYGRANEFATLDPSGLYTNEYYPSVNDDGRDYISFNGQVYGERSGSDGAKDYSITTDLTDNNIFIERKFREAVEDFLNDFQNKLYKSPTEGNIVINLMNVTMTPIESVGRMLYEFSATAYEIAENTLSNLSSLGIIDIGQFNIDFDEDEYYFTCGQVTFGVDPQDESANTPWKKIVEQEYIANPDGVTHFELYRVESFWIEPYPREKIQALINEQKIKNGLSDDDEEIKKLKTAWNRSGALPIKLKLQNEKKPKSQDGNTTEQQNNNNNLVYASPGRVYTLTDFSIKTLGIATPIPPVVINYIAKLRQRPNSTIHEVIRSGYKTDICQLSGLFSEDYRILWDYNFDYAKSKTLKVAENGLQSIYKSLDVIEVLKEEIKTSLEWEWDDETQTLVKKRTLTLQEDGSWKDENDNEYEFTGIESINIEADRGTLIEIGANDEQYQTVEIGKNQAGLLTKFDSNTIFFVDTLESESFQANYVHFVNTTFANINIIYRMSIKIMSNVEE